MISQAAPKVNIPFNKPYVDEDVFPYIREVIDRGKLSGDGPMCKTVEEQLREFFGIKHALLTSSCTHALEMATMTLNLQDGDEVITPSFTFVSTANAILRSGGKPVFCEIDGSTATIDPNDLERRITKRTKAVIVVHYAGVSAEMDAISELARRHNFSVIEDAAQGVNAKYKGKFLGTIGDIGSYSFHDTKNYVCGEGGAFVTNNEKLARKAEIVREKGTNRANFLRGEIDKYTWVEEGSSFILSDILAAVLKYQFDRLDEIQSRRKRVHELYMRELKDLESAGKLRLPVIPSHCDSNYHIFYILLKDEQERVMMTSRLKEFGIGATFHYVPLHSSPYAQASLGTKGLQLPVTDGMYQRLLRLPMYPQLEEADVVYIAEKIRTILK
ncbi:MAG TPA: dTDP-4-amino-4,6-dideoxygalactose transaminase [Bacteroidota bacterium]|nr:dTDP-4-amino-4,6-dideoxygalactose transaminase [Bacteroidota bacterium]